MLGQRLKKYINKSNITKKLKGGKVGAKDLEEVIKETYSKNPKNEIGEYILDKDLSTDEQKVYYNPKTGQALVSHRGTEGTLKDWSNNVAYAVGKYEDTDRYKRGEKVQKEAIKKYGKENISTIGHSQGAVLSRKLGKDTKEVINVNPAYKGEKQAKNEYNVRSGSDVVSALVAPVNKVKDAASSAYNYVFKPKNKKKKSTENNITIKAETYNPLTEHSPDILDRLPEGTEIGAGLRGGAIDIFRGTKLNILKMAVNHYLSPQEKEQYKHWFLMTKPQLIKTIIENKIDQQILQEVKKLHLTKKRSLNTIPSKLLKVALNHILHPDLKEEWGDWMILSRKHLHEYIIDKGLMEYVIKYINLAEDYFPELFKKRKYVKQGKSQPKSKPLPEPDIEAFIEPKGKKVKIKKVQPKSIKTIIKKIKKEPEPFFEQLEEAFPQDETTNKILKIGKKTSKGYNSISPNILLEMKRAKERLDSLNESREKELKLFKTLTQKYIDKYKKNKNTKKTVIPNLQKIIEDLDGIHPNVNEQKYPQPLKGKIFGYYENLKKDAYKMIIDELQKQIPELINDILGKKPETKEQYIINKFKKIPEPEPEPEPEAFVEPKGKKVKIKKVQPKSVKINIKKKIPEPEPEEESESESESEEEEEEEEKEKPPEIDKFGVIIPPKLSSSQEATLIYYDHLIETGKGLDSYQIKEWVEMDKIAKKYQEYKDDYTKKFNAELPEFNEIQQKIYNHLVDPLEELLADSKLFNAQLEELKQDGSLKKLSKDTELKKQITDAYAGIYSNLPEDLNTKELETSIKKLFKKNKVNDDIFHNQPISIYIAGIMNILRKKIEEYLFDTLSYVSPKIYSEIKDFAEKATKQQPEDLKK